MEFLGFRGYSEDDYVLAKNFIRNAWIISISSDIVETTIELRRKISIKLPIVDALFYC